MKAGYTIISIMYLANLAGVPDDPFRGRELSLVPGQLGRRP